MHRPLDAIERALYCIYGALGPDRPVPNHRPLLVTIMQDDWNGEPDDLQDALITLAAVGLMGAAIFLVTVLAEWL